MQIQKDIREKQLEEYLDVAADIIDGVLYDGKPVVKEDDLELISSSASQRMKTVRDTKAQGFNVPR